MKKYELRTEAWIGGKLRMSGEIVELTDAQAKYYLPPHSETLSPAKERSTARSAAKSEPRKTPEADVSK